MNTYTTPKDFFLHLGATIALYVGAIALINLAFSTINYALPDALAGYFYANAIVWPISMLIILTPTLYVIEWLINRDISVNMEKMNLWIRRWRIYLTLFLTGATIIGTLITLLNTYLNGEISTRFIYKVLAVLVVTGVIFGYYILERMNTRQGLKRVLAWLGVVVVLAGIISGFVVVGSPAKQRSIRMDNQRVSDLSTIQWQIITYWQQKEVLPSTLADLNDPISSYITPTDPKTKAQYDYRVISAAPMPTFELCANFDLSSEDNKGRGQFGRGGYASSDIGIAYPTGYGQEVWNHGPGKVCFERKVDPSRYPPVKRPSAI